MNNAPYRTPPCQLCKGDGKCIICEGTGIDPEQPPAPPQLPMTWKERLQMAWMVLRGGPKFPKDL